MTGLAQAARRGGITLAKGEEEALVAHLDPDERMVGYYSAIDLYGENNHKLASYPRFLTTDRRLLVVVQKGAFRTKYIFTDFPYGSLQPVIGYRENPVGVSFDVEYDRLANQRRADVLRPIDTQP